MEEQKADDLFRLFTKTDASAKQKKASGLTRHSACSRKHILHPMQGLGFSSAPAGDEKWRRDDSEPGFMQSMFVKAGASRPMTAGESAAVARREAEAAARSRQATASSVAAKLEAKAAELKQQRRSQEER